MLVLDTTTNTLTFSHVIYAERRRINISKTQNESCFFGTVTARAEITAIMSKVGIKSCNAHNFKVNNFQKVLLINVLMVLHITFILAPDIKKMFSLACDTDSYFLCSPSTHLQLHAVHSINIFFPSFSSVKFLGLLSSKGVVFWEVLDFGVCVHVSVHVLFCPWIYKHVPSISSFHRHAEVSVEDRSLSLCASLNCRLVFPIFLPKGKQEHISHICGRSSLLVFPLPSILEIYTARLPFICLPIKSRMASLCIYADTLHGTFSYVRSQCAWV